MKNRLIREYLFEKKICELLLKEINNCGCKEFFSLLKELIFSSINCCKKEGIIDYPTESISV